MEYTVEVRVELKKGALDAEGETVAKSLGLLGYEVNHVDTIKVYRITLEAELKEQAQDLMREAASKLLANPVIQEFDVKVV